jgi:hypothetical protein
MTIQEDLIEVNLDRTRKIMASLRRLGYEDPEVIGRIGADLGDIYAGAEHYKRLVDALLGLDEATGDPEWAGQTLSDLYEEMRHMGDHITSSLDDVDSLVDRFG